MACSILFTAHAHAADPLPPASSASARAQAADRPFGAPLNCTAERSSSPSAIAQSRFTRADVAAALAWADVELRRIGYGAPPPKDAGAGYIAALARSGHIVAAKMANDDLISSSKPFAASEWSRSFEAFLTIQTQPVNHASYPTSVRAEGEAPDAPGSNHHGLSVDLEATSAALREIVGRAALVQRALGKTYQAPAVRYYQLAQGFRDDIALEASASRVCALKLPPEELRKVDVSARMMAMPTRAEAGAAR